MNILNATITISATCQMHPLGRTQILPEEITLVQFNTLVVAGGERFHVGVAEDEVREGALCVGCG
jgi:hypothetical protein